MTISVEIRSNIVYMVEAKVNKTNIHVQNTHQFEFPEEWITEQGIVDVEAFSQRLMKEMAIAQIASKKVNLCLNNSSIIYRELTIPKVDAKRVPLLVRSEMMSALNLTPDYVMDHIELETLKHDETDYLRVLAVATLNTAIRSYLRAFAACKLKIMTIDSATNALLKLINLAKVAQKDEQVIIADIGNGHLRLYLFDDGIYALSRNTKHRVYVGESNDEIIDNIEENINKMIQYSYTRKSTHEIKKVYLMGVDELLPEIKRRAIENLNLAASICKNPPSITGKLESRYINAVGALIRK